MHMIKAFFPVYPKENLTVIVFRARTLVYTLHVLTFTPFGVSIM